MNIDNDLRIELLNFKINGKFDVTPYIIYTNLIMYAKFENGNVNGIELQRGQCLSSIPRLCEKTGLTEKSIRNAIKKLIDAGYIKKYATKHYTIFTVCHYDKKKNTEDKRDNSKQTVANNNLNDNEPMSQKQTEAERYRYLSEEILQRDLTAEEKEFFNNYNGG